MIQSKWQTYSPDSELRSFVYLQIQELSQFATDIGAVMVTLEESASSPKMYAATIIMSPLGVPLQSRVEADNMYDALSTAKQDAKSSLSATYSALDGVVVPNEPSELPPSTRVH